MRLDAVTDTAAPDASATPAPWYAGLATGLVSIVQQDRINKINLQRAQANLPPLDQSSLAPTVNVGLPPEQLKKIMLFGGLGLAAVLGVVLLARRR